MEEKIEECPICKANGRVATNVIWLESQNKYKCNDCGFHYKKETKEESEDLKVNKS